MRRESSTVVVPTGPVSPELLAALARLPNISVVRGTAGAPAENSADPKPEPRPGWEAGAAAMREAARRQSAFVVVADDPLAGVASAWQAMWELAAGPARDFYAGGLTETQLHRAQQADAGFRNRLARDQTGRAAPLTSPDPGWAR